jgi:hypothetical protein
LAEESHSLDRIITGGYSWCFQYETEMKYQSMQEKTPVSPRPKMAGTSQAQVRTMLLCFKHKVTVNFEFLEQR